VKKPSGMLKTSENKKFTVPGVDFSIKAKLISISDSGPKALGKLLLMLAGTLQQENACNTGKPSGASRETHNSDWLSYWSLLSKEVTLSQNT